MRVAKLTRKKREIEEDFPIGKLKKISREELKRIDDIIKAHLSKMEKKAKRRK
jgi:hypothetical protein